MLTKRHARALQDEYGWALLVFLATIDHTDWSSNVVASLVGESIVVQFATGIDVERPT